MSKEIYHVNRVYIRQPQTNLQTASGPGVLNTCTFCMDDAYMTVRSYTKTYKDRLLETGIFTDYFSNSHLTTRTVTGGVSFPIGDGKQSDNVIYVPQGFRLLEL